MQFLDRGDTLALARRLKRQVNDRDAPKAIVYYASGKVDYAAAAREIVAALDDFAEAQLLFLDTPFGDGWPLEAQPGRRWQRYYDWRRSHHDMRRLGDAPGHVFSTDERAGLERAIAFALELGWDAVLAARPGRHHMTLSHDDRLEIWSGLHGRALGKRLECHAGWTLRR